MDNIINIIAVLILLSLLFSVTYAYREPGVCVIDPMLEKLRRDLIKVDPRAAKLQYFPGDESYTEDKEKIFICMRDEKGEYYPYNDLIQVGLHELSHALTNVIDVEHKTPEFNGMHNDLRKRAVDLGLFNPDKTVATTYCAKKD